MDNIAKLLRQSSVIEERTYDFTLFKQVEIFSEIIFDFLIFQFSEKFWEIFQISLESSWLSPKITE